MSGTAASVGERTREREREPERTMLVQDSRVSVAQSDNLMSAAANSARRQESFRRHRVKNDPAGTHLTLLDAHTRFAERTRIHAAPIALVYFNFFLLVCFFSGGSSCSGPITPINSLDDWQVGGCKLELHWQSNNKVIDLTYRTVLSVLSLRRKKWQNPQHQSSSCLIF